MAELWKIFVLVVGLSHVACNNNYAICGSSEEGRSHSLTCGQDATQSHNASYLLEGKCLLLCSCKVIDRSCDISRDDVNCSINTNGSLNVYIRNVSREQAKFRCEADDIEFQECTIDVFVTPTKPTCSDPILSNNDVIVTCRTENVYPSAACSFEYRSVPYPVNITTKNISDTNVNIYSILYKNTPSTVSPGNNATECELTIPLAIFPGNFYQFRVIMYPNSRAKPNEQEYISATNYTRILSKVPPAEPTCSYPFSKDGGITLLVPCKTTTMYPSIECTFQYLEDQSSNPVTINEGAIKYTRLDKEYRCILSLPMSSLAKKYYQFRVILSGLFEGDAIDYPTESNYTRMFGKDSFAECGSSEEGESHVLTCGRGATQRYIVLHKLGQTIVPFLNCSVPEKNCQYKLQNDRDNYFNYSFTTNGSLNVYIRAVSKNITEFTCGLDRKVFRPCKINVFVTPTKPTCSDPIISNNNVTVTCVTEKVYPSAVCLFQYRLGPDPMNITSAEIWSSTGPSKIGFGNNATNCSLTLPMSNLTKYYQFRVLMYPDSPGAVNRSKYFSTSDYTNSIATVHPAKPTCSKPVLLNYQESLVLTCKTMTVFPPVWCIFQYKWLSKDESPKDITGHTTNTPTDLGQECTLSLPLHDFVKDYYRFRVIMMTVLEGKPSIYKAENDYTGNVTTDTFADCGSFEEGEIHTLTCGPKARQSYTVYHLRGGQYAPFCNCNVTAMTCDISDKEEYFDYSIDSYGRLNIYIAAISKERVKFRCEVDGVTSAECEIRIFVSPTKPTCSDPILSNNDVIVTCRTERVYPSAACSFEYRSGPDPVNITTKNISYITSPSTVSPGNKATECTLTIPLSELPGKFYQFRVIMRANSNRTVGIRAFYAYSDYTHSIATATGQIMYNSVMTYPQVPKDFAVSLLWGYEEGEVENVFCECETVYSRFSLSLQLYLNGSFINIVTCFGSHHPGECQVFFPENYTVHYYQPEYSYVRMNVTVTRGIDRSNDIFRCVKDGKMIILTYQIGVYVKPEAPTCSVRYSFQDDTVVLVSCETVQVYPRAKCQFIDNGNYVGSSVEIFYKDTPSYVNLRNGATECVAFFPVGSLSAGNHSFSVYMFPDVYTPFAKKQIDKVIGHGPNPIENIFNKRGS